MTQGSSQISPSFSPCPGLLPFPRSLGKLLCRRRPYLGFFIFQKSRVKEMRRAAGIFKRADWSCVWERMKNF
jgi:hypothetical protein